MKYNKKRMIRFTQFSVWTNAGLAVGKMILAIFTLSVFMCINALYNIGLMIAKQYAVSGLKKTEDANEQYGYCFIMGIILMAASFLYIIYSIRMFISPPTTRYPMIAAIAIATFTFTEIVINIIGWVKARKHDPLSQAIKMTNLASSLICLVLTQTAILSFTMENGTPSYSNGFAGVIFGVCAAVIGLFIFRIHKKV